MLRRVIQRSVFVNVMQPRYQYMKHEIKERDEHTSDGYYQDPNEIAARMCKLVAMHEKTKFVQKINLDSTWHEMGVDELSLVEIMLEAEDEFYLELPDEEVERFSNIRDATEYIARSFYTAY